MAYGILAPYPGLEPPLPALEAQSFNQWTTQESLVYHRILNVTPCT